MSEAANAHIQSIISLPTIYGTNPGKIHEFLQEDGNKSSGIGNNGKIMGNGWLCENDIG